jgi:hypothetical protein
LILRGLTGFWDLGSGKFRKRDNPVVDLVLRRNLAEKYNFRNQYKIAWLNKSIKLPDKMQQVN